MASPLGDLRVGVFVLHLIAFGLAVAAEQMSATATRKRDASHDYCVYESDIVTGLGVVSFVFLLAAHLLIMLASGCMCCGRAFLQPGPWPRLGPSKSYVVFLFITCWVAFIIAEACLMAGSVTNAYHTKYTTFLSVSKHHPPSCEMLRKGVFGAGAASIVVTGILSQLYYAVFKATEACLPIIPNTRGTRMGALNK